MEKIVRRYYGETLLLRRENFLSIALTLIAIFCCLLLSAVLALRMWGEPSGTNSYAIMAQSFINLQPDVATCFDTDCIQFQGKNYVIFPPFPGVLSVPLVWLNGVYTTGFVLLSVILSACSLWLWNSIFKAQLVVPLARFWLVLAIGFASPLYYVTLRGEGVWFMAQSCAFFLVTFAIYASYIRKWIFSAGLAIGAAILCRQLSILYVPLIYILWVGPDASWFKIDRVRLKALFLLAISVGVGVALYGAYNYWRFGNVMETGYKFLITTDDFVLGSRLQQHGLWDKSYVLANFFYLFLQGFHAQFSLPQQISLEGMDPLGTSILSASPWLLLVFFMRMNRLAYACCLTAVCFIGITVFYHSNGFSQYNVQRYVLEWLPAILLVVSSGLTPPRLEWVRLLVCWGLVLNLATMFVLAVTKLG